MVLLGIDWPEEYWFFRSRVIVGERRMGPILVKLLYIGGSEIQVGLFRRPDSSSEVRQRSWEWRGGIILSKT
jgi:hypothetical protein